MSIERYRLLTVPRRNDSHLRIFILIAISWLLPSFVWILAQIVYSMLNNAIEAQMCVSPIDPYGILVLCIIFYVIPMACMIFFYLCIIRHVNRSTVLYDCQNSITNVLQVEKSKLYNF
jgi:hypothetical protein